MASFSQTIIIGNLGRDPEVKEFSNGDSVTNFSVAVTESWKDKTSGEKKENTTWFNVSAGQKLGEICAKYLKKGSQVQIVGKMVHKKYEKDGEKKEFWELRADSMTMLGGRDSSQAAPNPDAKPKAQKPSDGGFNDFEDDIPF